MDKTTSPTVEEKVLAQLTDVERQRVGKYQQLCTSCGACCCFYAEQEGMINADGVAGDIPKLSYHKKVVKRFRWPDGDEEIVEESGMVMRTKQLKTFPACVALEGEPGLNVACSIYAERPLHCRLFVPGSNMCLTARKWAGFE